MTLNRTIYKDYTTSLERSSTTGLKLSQSPGWAGYRPTRSDFSRYSSQQLQRKARSWIRPRSLETAPMRYTVKYTFALTCPRDSSRIQKLACMPPANENVLPRQEMDNKIWGSSGTPKRRQLYTILSPNTNNQTHKL